MRLLEVTVAMTVTAGGWTLDLSPVVALPAPLMPHACALTTAPVVWYDPACDLTPDLVREELLHVRQQQHLGPAFYLAYAATYGLPFEPYDTRTGEPDGHLRNMWQPPAGAPVWPMLRVANRDGWSVTFMPLPRGAP